MTPTLALSLALNLTPPLYPSQAQEMRQLQATVEEERALGPKWRQAQAEGAPGVAAYRVLYDGHVPSAGAMVLTLA
eukprot:scaffold87325_cov48-Phaeocystis_antarctica.AAC.10